MEYVNEQGALLESVQRALRNFKKDAPSRKTVAYYQTRLEMLTSLRAEFRENHRKIMQTPKDQEIIDSYISIDFDDKFEEAYLDAMSVIRQANINAFPPTSPNQASNLSINALTSNDHPAQNTEVPLPEVKIPTFDGNYVEWPTFKEIFIARVHNSGRLNNCQRLHYLKGALTGAAAKDIQHINLLGENYHDAWNMLCNLYDNDRILFSHFMDVFEPLPRVPNEDPAALRQFTQTCRSCVNSIQKLGVDTNSENHIFVYYMSKRLPPVLQREWERAISKKRTVPSFDDLCAVLDEQYQIMITSTIHTSHLSAQMGTHELRRKNIGASLSNKREVTSLHLAKGANMCPVCTKGEHPVRDCSVFLGFNLADRKAVVRKLKLCYNCLGYNYHSSKCSSRRTCMKCGVRHHTLIHTDESTEQSTSTSMHLSIEKGGFSTVTKPSANNYNFDVLLPTAVVTVDDKEGQPYQFRAFF